MTTLSDLIGHPITPEASHRHTPRVEILSAPIQVKSQKPPRQYEGEVFNYLLANKEVLGIKSVMKFTALLVDGAVELLDGKRLTLEIKFRMNWEKACQAESQFRNFLKETDRKPFPVDGGIVFFEEFSGDWNRKAGCRFLENGWNHWYRGHSVVDGLRVDLLRLRAGRLDSFPMLDAVVANVAKMTREETNRLLEQLRAAQDNRV
jgi:hypothetical protein